MAITLYTCQGPIIWLAAIEQVIADSDWIFAALEWIDKV